MRLIHLSDLHFGTQEGDIVDELSQAISDASPDFIIVSGDFTQVASSKEFVLAKRFIEALPAPVFSVPGNHDIPRYGFGERFFNPYRRYKKYIHDELCPTFINDQVVVAGINSARRILPHWNWANGAISQQQLQYIQNVYKKHDPDHLKRRICVFHHPIQRALNSPMNTVVFGARKALECLNTLQVDLVLTGHVHHAAITTLGDGDHTTIYLSASTALSSRLREQENGFNVISLHPEGIEIEVFAHDGKTFELKNNYAQRIGNK